MATTIFVRGTAISAVAESDDQLNVAVNGTTIAELRTTGISALAISAADLVGTTASIGTLCGSTAASAINLGGMTYTGGSSACTSGGTVAYSADHFIKCTLGGKTYYIPAYASAGALSAV